VEGQLSVREDVSKHEGAFRSAVEGGDRTLDAVIAPIAEAPQVLEQPSQRRGNILLQPY